MSDLMTKEELRRLVSAKRKELDPIWIEQHSLAAQRCVMELPEFEKACVVCCYLAMASEVRTDRLIEACWKRDREVCVPAFSPKDKRYRLTLLKKGTPLIRGPGHVWEPARTRWIALDKVEFVIVPGVAFDTTCGRVGRGGGHYDRILGTQAGGMGLFKAGLAFDFQIFRRVPVNPAKDVKMDVIVTDKRVIRDPWWALEQAMKGKTP